MAKSKIVHALVTAPTYINGVLHQPGELAHADLDALGVNELGDKTPGLKAHSGKSAEPVTQVKVAAVAPHAPDAPNPQGLPTGSVQSGTGRMILPDVGGDDPEAIEPVGADKLDRSEEAAATKQQGKTVKPSK